MKLQLGILSLVMVLVYSQDPEPQACSTKTLGPDELPQVRGDWVLVWLVYNGVVSQDRRFDLMSSSHVRVRIHGQTLKILERNTVGGRCVAFDFSLTFAQSSDGINKLDMHRTEVEIDGVKSPIDSRATIQFLPAAEDTLKLLFRGHNQEDMLAVYRREGHHLEQQQNLEENRATARCAGLSGGDFQEWTFDRHSDFCHKSVLPSLGPGQLRQVQGDWAVVALVYDQVKSQGRQIPHMSSSHISVQNKDDHIDVQEHNMVGGHCAFFPFNMTLPPSGSDIHRLPMHRTKWFLNGEQQPLNEKGTVEFFSVSANTMRVLYRGKDQPREDFLVMYRRYGHQGPILEQDLENHTQTATNLGLSGGNYTVWKYSGAEDFCHKTAKTVQVQS